MSNTLSVVEAYQSRKGAVAIESEQQNDDGRREEVDSVQLQRVGAVEIEQLRTQVQNRDQRSANILQNKTRSGVLNTMSDTNQSPVCTYVAQYQSVGVCHW